MRLAAFLILSASGAWALEPGSTLWATVPASRQATRIETFAVPVDEGDNVISLVGETSNRAVAARERVVALDLAAGVQASIGNEAQRIPPETIWPGPDGKVTAAVAAGDQAGAATALRNPWLVRARPRREISESIFVSGGVIGAGSGAVALLNGRIAQKGSNIDGYEVSMVTASAVVLRRGGVLYAVPTGRRIVIEAAQH